MHSSCLHQPPYIFYCTVVIVKSHQSYYNKLLSFFLAIITLQINQENRGHNNTNLNNNKTIQRIRKKLGFRPITLHIYPMNRHGLLPCYGLLTELSSLLLGLRDTFSLMLENTAHGTCNNIETRTRAGSLCGSHK